MNLSDIIELLQQGKAFILIEHLNIYVNEQPKKEQPSEQPKPGEQDAKSLAFFSETLPTKRNGKSE